MGAYKQLLAQDIIITPFEVNKGFTFFSSEITISSSKFYTSSLVLTEGNYYTLNLSGSTGSFYITASVTSDFVDENFEIYDGQFGSPTLIFSSTGSSYTINNTFTVSSGYLTFYNVGSYGGSNITASNLSVIQTGSYVSSQLISSDVGIDRFIGKNITASLRNTENIFNPNSDPTTGQISTQYQRLVYNSIKELYYSNYLSGSYGSSASLATLIPGNDTEGNRLVGGTYTPAFDNYLQTTLSYPHYFPTESNAIIGVLAIPSRLFGDNIQPNSFYYKTSNGTYIDDGEGNVLSGSNIVGNIIYQHGMIILTSASNSDIDSFATGSNVTCSFSSSYSIYETQYKCTIRESEFNFSQNPTLLSGSSDDTLYNFATGSYFAPYITTVGLYDEMQNLVAVGKLSQPLPSSRTTDMTIYVNIDR